MKTIPPNAPTALAKKNIHGILLLDKAQGLTSNHALQKIKRLYSARKAGHCGTLDPLATGMLPICLGEATKFSQYLIDADKTYEVEALLGITTTTGDSEGEVLTRTAVPETVTAQLPTVLQQFTGNLAQTPPMYSALKHQGRALYDYARAGITIPRAPRQIIIQQIDLLSLDLPLLRLCVHCSKGTYIRVLIEDIGQVLGCGAHVVALRRTQIHGLPCEPLLSITALENLSESDRVSQLHPLDIALQRLPRVLLNDTQRQQLLNGIKIPYPTSEQATEVAAYHESGTLIGVATCRDNLLIAKRLLASTHSY